MLTISGGDVRIINNKLTGESKSRTSNNIARNWRKQVCRITCRIYKRQSSIEEVPIRDDEEEKVGINDEEDIFTPLTFWHASDNAGEEIDLAEPATFQDAINGTK